MKTKTLISFMLIAILFSACNSKQKNNLAANDTQTPENVILRGEYLVNALGCTDCHSPKVMTDRGPAPDESRLLSGHNSEEKLAPYDSVTARSYVLFNMSGTAAIGPWGTSFAGNLTPDETGIGNWTEGQFLIAMKEGKWKGQPNGRDLLPPMPWQGYTNMSDEDLKAIFAYLKSLKPVKNLVPMAIPPQTN